MNTHDTLHLLLTKITCKPGWRFKIVHEDDAPRLIITVTGPDAADPKRTKPINHYFPVPEATYNERSWRRWVFDCCHGVENHELGEWFRVDGERPFAPLHGPGENPYTVQEYRDDVERRTAQNGTVRET